MTIGEAKRKINRLWRRSESPDKIFPLQGWLGDTVICRLSTGGYGVLFELGGIEPDGVERKTLDYYTGQIAQIRNSLPDGMIVYEYLISGRMGPVYRGTYADPVVAHFQTQRADYLDAKASLKSVALFVSLYLPAPRGLDLLRPENYGAKKRVQVRKIQVGASLFFRQMSDLCPVRICDRDALCSFFSYLETLDPRLVISRCPKVDPAAKLCNAQIRWAPLMIGRRYLKTFSLIDRPANGTRPNLWGDITQVDAELVLCGIWRSKNTRAVRSEVKDQERASVFNSASLSDIFASGLFDGNRPVAPTEKNASEMAQSEKVVKLAAILKQLDNGRSQGFYSLHGFLHGEDWHKLDRAMIDVQHVFSKDSDARVYEEGVGEMGAYLAMFPGGYNLSRDPVWLQDDHAADLAFVYRPQTGTPVDPNTGLEHVLTYQTKSGTPFYLQWLYRELGNMLVIGGPRRGKSLNVNMMVLSEAKYGGFVFIFDFGSSYDYTVLSLGGTVSRMGLDAPRMNPFAEPRSKETSRAITHLVLRMLERGAVVIDFAVEQTVTEAVEMVYDLPPTMRRLAVLKILLGDLGNALAKFCEDGIYARVWDNVEDDLSIGRIHSFDFTGLKDKMYAEQSELLLGWLFYRIKRITGNPEYWSVPKTIVAEEIWTHIEDERMMAFVLDTAKSDPKNLGRLIVVLQYVTDLGRFSQAIRNACPVTMHLGGDVGEKEYRDFFKLNQAQFDIVSRLPKQHLMLQVDSTEGKADGFTKELILNIDSQMLAMFSTTPQERYRRIKLIEQHGPQPALQILAAELDGRKQQRSA